MMASTRRALVIAGAYALIAGTWIVLSGAIARGLAGSVEELERLERFKGMVEHIVSLLRGHSALQHCEVTIDAPANVTLPAFPVLIDQVLINLLLNAADATGGQGRLEVRVRATKDEARLEVHDDGKGLPPEMEAMLFKPFATTKPHGTGLGLVSVRECALAHGGRVEYARSPLGGAAFSVSLPLVATPAA